MADNTYMFSTAIGSLSISWTPKGIVRVVMRPRKTNCAEVTPPKYIENAARRIANHLAGEVDDLRDIRVDLSSCPPFAQKIYRTLRKVPPGKVVTYGELARRAGNPGAARAVGRAMATNPVPIIIPCHRVIASGGKLGGFSSPGGIALKSRLLSVEGVDTPLHWV